MIATAWTWICSHPYLVAGFAVLLLASLRTGLSRYPRAAEAVHWIGIVLDLLSVVTHKDSRDTFKLPGTRSTPPDGKAPPSTPADPPGVGLPLCLVLLMALGSSACNPRQTAAWRSLSAASLECFAPGAKAALAGAADKAIKDLAGPATTDWKAYGKSLAAEYGGSIALCIIGQAIAKLGPVVFGGEPEGSPRPALNWLDAHRDQWLP